RVDVLGTDAGLLEGRASCHRRLHPGGPEHGRAASPEALPVADEVAVKSLGWPRLGLPLLDLPQARGSIALDGAEVTFLDQPALRGCNQDFLKVTEPLAVAPGRGGVEADHHAVAICFKQDLVLLT